MDSLGLKKKEFSKEQSGS